MRVAFITVTAIFATASLGGCDHSFPDGEKRATLSGVVSYKGRAHLSMNRPAVQVAAFTTFPPKGLPHALLVVEAPDFTRAEGVPYTLTLLPDHKYFVFARLFDLDRPQDQTTPLGGYPDFCTISGGSANVEVAGGADKDKLDVTLYDNVGNDDPCFKVAPSTCPKPGKGTLIFEATGFSKSDVGPRDRLTFATFTEWPPTTNVPAAFSIKGGAELSSFPVRWINNTVEPGAYAAFACYDRGGNNLTDCGTEDVQAIYDGGKLFDVAAGFVVTVSIDLASGASKPLKSQKASNLGCTAP